MQDSLTIRMLVKDEPQVLTQVNRVTFLLAVSKVKRNSGLMNGS
jgi:hypothetical protein